MADEEDVPPKTQPARASKLALSAAAEIADWCEGRKNEAITDAKWQMKTVWFLLGGGVILLLVLPRLVALIDYAAATLPPVSVEEAEDALALMETNESEMQEALNQAISDLAARQEELEEAEMSLQASIRAFEEPFEDPLSVWRDVGPDIPLYKIRYFAQRDNGDLFGVGMESASAGPETFILHAPDGASWSAIRPSEAGVRIGGQLETLLVSPDGGLVAAGMEYAESLVLPGAAAPNWAPSETLLLRSPDGASWSPIRPSEAGARIKGHLFGLALAPDGALIAAGSEWTNEGGKTLILRSPDGESWSPIRPSDEGARIAGILHDVVRAPDGGLIATGVEGTVTGRGAIEKPETLLLHSLDGAAWLPIRPSEAGSRIAGMLYKSASSPERGVVVAGLERTGKRDLTLLMGSKDGMTWSPIRPKKAGTRSTRIAGWLLSVVHAPDGDLLAAGFGTTDDINASGMLLSSEDGQNWSAVSPKIAETVDNGGYWSLFVSGDNARYAAGPASTILRPSAYDKKRARQALLEGEQLQDLAVPAGSAERAKAMQQNKRLAQIARERASQQQTIRDQASNSHKRQTKAVAQIEKANENLENALRRTEPVRQASWIATRLAVLALLIFLVQIVVNRYRYLQRLADFYDGRAQAFRMLANSGPTAAGAILHDVSLNELMAGLSPSSISFGREAEPPTQHLMSMLQSAMKK